MCLYNKKYFVGILIKLRKSELSDNLILFRSELMICYFYILRESSIFVLPKYEISIDLYRISEI